MPNVLPVIVAVGGITLAINRDVLHVMRPFRQTRPDQSEACGILLGYEWDAAQHVIMATEPQASDIRGRAFYTRNVAGHLKTAREAWTASGGLVGYVGEWHSHPQVSPAPSSTDIAEAKKLATSNAQTIISLIMGTSEACVFLAEAKTISEVVSFQLPTCEMPLRSSRRCSK